MIQGISRLGLAWIGMKSDNKNIFFRGNYLPCTVDEKGGNNSVGDADDQGGNGKQDE